MPGIDFQEVARLVSCEAFARRELPMRGNRAKCPFHGGEHYNLAFYRDGKCYCHVCHRTADSVQLAAAAWKVPQIDAARLLNDEFKLGLSGSTPTEEQRQQRQRQREQLKAEEQIRRDYYNLVFDEVQTAQRAIERFTIEDTDKPEFDKALRRLVKWQNKLELLDYEMNVGC